VASGVPLLRRVALQSGTRVKPFLWRRRHVLSAAMSRSGVLRRRKGVQNLACADQPALAAHRCGTKRPNFVLAGIARPSAASIHQSLYLVRFMPAHCVVHALGAPYALITVCMHVQTMLEACTQSQRCSSSLHQRGSGALSSANTEDSSDAFYASSVDLVAFTAAEPRRLSLDVAAECDGSAPSRYQTCVSMIRYVRPNVVMQLPS
jgi:hypothetical protein